MRHQKVPDFRFSTCDEYCYFTSIQKQFNHFLTMDMFDIFLLNLGVSLTRTIPICYLGLHMPCPTTRYYLAHCAFGKEWARLAFGYKYDRRQCSVQCLKNVI